MRATLLACVVLFSTPFVAAQQAPTGPDAEVAAAYADCQKAWTKFTDAAMAARKAGGMVKGAELPEGVLALQKAADDARGVVLQRFGARGDLAPASFVLLARLHEQGRDYVGAVGAYERAVAGAKEPDLAVMSSLCIAAMNSKDDAVAAKWMKATIAAEDAAGAGRREDAVRTSWYPRTLIALGDWPALERHLAALAADPAPQCKAAAATFGVVAAIHRGDLEKAKAGVAAIRADAAGFPDHQAWAVMASFALLVHDGEFAAAERVVREHLAAVGDGGTAADKNWRRYLQAVAPFVGKPAPRLRVDHQVGGEVAGPDVLATLRGKVVVLDFWQPWCEPCRKAMPEMCATQREHAAELQVLGVCKVENYGYDVSERRAVRPIAPADYPAHIADFRQDMQLNYPVAICDTGENGTNYGLAGVPTLVVIDRAGVVRYMSCGAGEPGLFRLAVEGVLRAK